MAAYFDKSRKLMAALDMSLRRASTRIFLVERRRTVVKIGSRTRWECDAAAETMKGVTKRSTSPVKKKKSSKRKNASRPRKQGQGGHKKKHGGVEVL